MKPDDYGYEIHLTSGVEGPHIAIYKGNLGRRIVGPKAWGGGTILHRWPLPLAEILAAIPELMIRGSQPTEATEVQALERCWGQQSDEPGSPLHFVVKVYGLGASPRSPQEIAKMLCTQWTEGVLSEIRVEVDEASRAALDALKETRR